MTIRLRDVTKVASVIDTLVTAGANDIGGINFMVSQASKLLDDARGQAVADARRKAEIYAKAAGVTLGAPLSISEEGAAQPLFRARMAAPMAAAPAPIAQGEETLSITVGMTWAIKRNSNRLSCPGRGALRSDATQSRDLSYKQLGPGSAAHRYTLRCVRGTRDLSRPTAAKFQTPAPA